MAVFIVDRRKSGGGKSIPNRNRFLTRVQSRIAAQVKKMISQGGVTSIFEAGKKVTIPVGDLSEPHPSYDREGGQVDMIVSGNVNYRVGDLIQKRGGGDGGGGNGAGDGSGGGGSDDFSFTLTRDEFIKYFFEDLELPNLADKEISVAEKFRVRKAGFTTDGSPANLSLMQTMKSSVGRRMALRAAKKKKVKELELQLEGLLTREIGIIDEAAVQKHKLAIAELEAAIEKARAAVKKVPFVDDIDLRYRNTIVDPLPTTKAVMFCLMDVSGSMTEWHKDIAKRYYMLLFLFLQQRYEQVEVVFVRHHHDAEEVDEQTFFYDRANGGTVVSKGLELVNNIVKDRFPRNQWNVYIAQASDGDNFHDDEARVLDLMQNSILPAVQYFFYIEINRYGRSGDLWQTYKQLEGQNFDAQTVEDASQIYEVFRKMFSPK